MWRRARLRGTVVVVLLGALGVWLSVGLVLGLPVVGGEATVRHCDALGGVRTRVCRWVGRPLLPDGRHEVPAQVVIGAVLLVAALLVARALTARNRNGPVRVTEVQLGGGANGSPDPRTAATLALIRECLHTAGVNAQGVVPSYSGIATSGAEVVGAAGYPAPVNLLTRMSVAWVQTSVLNLGWVVTVTETPAEAPFRCGLTYSVQRVVTGVIEMTDTCWGTGLEDCARKVGYQLAAWREQNGRAGRDRRGGPSTSPHSLRHQHEALLDARHRRFDATIQRARAGLNADPTNMRLRRILGETYERLGLGLDAFIVYASGLIFMDDTRNGWRRTLSAGDAMGEASKVADAGRQGWQPRRDPRRRDPRRRDPDRQGVLW